MEHIGWRYKVDGKWTYVDGIDNPMVDVPAEKVFGEPSHDDLEEAMVAAGMLTATQLISGNTPLSKYETHSGMDSIEFYGKWLQSKYDQFSHMFFRYETGLKEKDELYEWVFSHYAAFKDALLNFNKANHCIVDLDYSYAILNVSGDGFISEFGEKIPYITKLFRQARGFPTEQYAQDFIVKNQHHFEGQELTVVKITGVIIES